MKKFIIAIMAFIYLTITSGVVIDMHYCMNKLSSVNLQYTESDTCGKCGMKSKGDCCKDELKIVKLSDEHKYIVAIQQFHIEPVVIETFAIPGFITKAQELIITAKANAPPILRDPAIYIKNCVFRI